MSITEISDKILEVHDGIRWVIVTDPKGRIVVEKKKEHVTSYLTEDAMKNDRELWITCIQGMITNVARYWGAPQHLHIQFKKITLFGFPCMGGSVIVTAEPDVPLSVINKIQEILTRFMQEQPSVKHE